MDRSNHGFDSVRGHQGRFWLKRENVIVARCTEGRIMASMGLHGAVRGRRLSQRADRFSLAAQQPVQNQPLEFTGVIGWFLVFLPCTHAATTLARSGVRKDGPEREPLLFCPERISWALARRAL